jgi:hypothetical protein
MFIGIGEECKCNCDCIANIIYGIILIGAIVLQGGSLPNFYRWEVMRMSTYETLSLLFLAGNFLIALLAYIDRNNKRK